MPGKREREKRESWRELSVLRSGRQARLLPRGASQCGRVGQKRRARAIWGLVLALAWLLGQGLGLGAIGEEFLIIPSAGSPTVTYDPANQRFLMTYPGAGLQGQMLDAGGNRVGSRFTITTNTGCPCAVAYDPVNWRFLVVWSYPDVWGQLINADGTPFGTNFAISTASGLQHFPSAAYDPVSQSFLVVWVDEGRAPSAVDIYGQRVGADGRLVGPEIAIDTGAEFQDEPKVGYDSANQRFLVVYQDGSSISGQRVRADGRLVGAKFPIPANSFGPAAVVYDAVHGRFLVVWSEGSIDGADVLGRLVNADGTLFGGTLRISTTTRPDEALSANVAYDPARQRFLVVWWVWNSDPQVRGYYGRQVNADGTLFLDRELRLPTAGFPQESPAPAIAYDPVNQRFLMARERYNFGTDLTDIYGMLLAGLPLKPLASLSLNAQSFRPGDPLNLEVRVFTPPYAPPTGNWSFEAAAWIETPMDFPSDLISIVNIGGPGNHVTLPPGFGQSFPLLHLPAVPAVPAGSYKFGVRLNHPITREEFWLDEAPFEVTSP